MGFTNAGRRNMNRTKTYGGIKVKLSFNVRKILAVSCVCASVMMTAACSESFDENTKYTDLYGYYSIHNIGGNSGAAVIIDGTNVGTCMVADGEYFVAYENVREYMDDRFYWDETEKVLTYASSRHVYDAVPGSTEYTMDGVAQQHSGVILYEVDEKAYINVRFVKLMNNFINIDIYSNPERVIISTLKNADVVVTAEAAKLRTDAGVGNEIVADVGKNEELYLLEEQEKWSCVYSKDGMIGYVENSKLTEPSTREIAHEQSWLDTEPYTYFSKDNKICLGWHQMESEAGNDSFASVTSEAGELNVISPTWFKLTDSYGGISSLASRNYVNKAHNNNMEVWALVNDFNCDEQGNYFVNQVVPVTSSRRNLIENIMAEAEACGMDGINIDFEMVRKASSEGYVQFIRELAIRCDEAGIVLSVDMYTPTESNRYYDRQSVGEAADYVIVMGYDEHWAGCGQAGSVASLPFVTNGILNTLSEVPAERVINAVPFYTRVWYEDEIENAPENSIIVEDSVNGDYALSSKAVGMDNAKELLKSNGANLVWMEELGQYYGEYYAEERLARVWLEDKESLSAKLGVMKRNNLAGVACWKLGLESEEAWEAIGEFLK